MVNFTITPEERDLINQIAERAFGLARAYGSNYALSDILMDVTACHANGCPLKLKELLEAPEMDFWHDITGIYLRLDRKTGKLTCCFLPRYAAHARYQVRGNEDGYEVYDAVLGKVIKDGYGLRDSAQQDADQMNEGK